MAPTSQSAKRGKLQLRNHADVPGAERRLQPTQAHMRVRGQHGHGQGAIHIHNDDFRHLRSGDARQRGNTLRGVSSWMTNGCVPDALPIEELMNSAGRRQEFAVVKEFVSVRHKTRLQS
jgi:hypothetical protein